MNFLCLYRTLCYVVLQLLEWSDQYGSICRCGAQATGCMSVQMVVLDGLAVGWGCWVQFVLFRLHAMPEVSTASSCDVEPYKLYVWQPLSCTHVAFARNNCNACNSAIVVAG